MISSVCYCCKLLNTGTSVNLALTKWRRKIGAAGHKWGDTEKNRTNVSREGDPRKKITMVRSCHKNGWSTHSEASTTVGSRMIQEKTWKTKDKLERHGEQGPSKIGIKLGRGWSISSRQTDLASTSAMLNESSRVKSRCPLRQNGMRHAVRTIWSRACAVESRNLDQSRRQTSSAPLLALTWATAKLCSSRTALL